MADTYLYAYDLSPGHGVLHSLPQRLEDDGFRGEERVAGENAGDDGDGTDGKRRAEGQVRGQFMMRSHPGLATALDHVFAPGRPLVDIILRRLTGSRDQPRRALPLLASVKDRYFVKDRV